MPKLSIVAVKDADNSTALNVFDENNDPIDLDAAGATAVKVEVCGELHNSVIDAESFSGNNIVVKFGKLQLPATKGGQTYSPKIYYVTPTESDGVVIAACGFETSISLKMVC